MKMKLTLTLIIVMLPLMTGCVENRESDAAIRHFTITNPHQEESEDTCCRLRFNSIKKKDEKTVAMEKASGQWNRNLYLMGNCPSLDEYAEVYGENP